jgi:hypothetical protein
LDPRDLSGLMKDVNTLLGGEIINPAIHSSIRRVVSRILEGQRGGVDGYVAFGHVSGTDQWFLSISGFGTRTRAQDTKRAIQDLGLPLMTDLRVRKERGHVDSDAFSILMMIGIESEDQPTE